jgi:hypothetical protein
MLIQNRVTPLDEYVIEQPQITKEDQHAKTNLREHIRQSILPSLLDLTSFHRDGCGGTGIGALDVVFVIIRHGWGGVWGV